MFTHAIRPPEWIPTAPIRTATSVEIAAVPEAVWAGLADHASWPEWFPLLDRVEVTGSPTGVGGTRRVIIQRLPFDEEFTVWDEPWHPAWAVTGSRLPMPSLMAESVRLEVTDAGCRVELTQGLWASRGLGRALGPMWRRHRQRAGRPSTRSWASGGRPGLTGLQGLRASPSRLVGDAVDALVQHLSGEGAGRDNEQ